MASEVLESTIISDLTALTMHQKYATGSTVFQSIIANSILTLPDRLQEPGSDTVLTLGSTGDVQFVVRGIDDMGRMSVDDQNVLNFSSKDVMWITGNDANKTVGISKTVFTYDAYQGKNTIDAGEHYLPDGSTMKKKFEMDARVTKFTGSAQIGGDIITNGHIIARSMNLGLVEDSNVSIGFGFRVTDAHTLEMYKYDRSNNYTSRIATFGEGTVKKNDAYSNFPVFAQSNYEPNDQLMLGDNTSPLWEAEGANIYYIEGKVLVGTSNATENIDYTMEVKNKMYVENGIELGSFGIDISGNEIKNIDRLHFTTPQEEDPIVVDGKLSSVRFDYIPENNNSTWLRRYQNQVVLGSFSNNLTLNSFYKGIGMTWFDKPQETVLLNSFSNNLVNFDNFEVATLNANVFNINEIKFLDNAYSNVFKGEIGQLAGISSFKLSEFDDDIDHKVNLSVDNLAVSRFTTDLIPQTSLTVGSDTDRTSTIFTNEVNIGDSGSDNVVLSYQNNNLNINKPLFLEQGIQFADGSTISSFSGSGGGGGDKVNELIDPVIQVYKVGYDYEAYTINGTFQFSLSHSKIRTEMGKLYVYNVINGDASILLPDNEGNILTTGEDVKLIHEQNTTHFNMDLINEDGTAYEGGLYLSPYDPQNGNEIINLKVFMPSTIEFSQKFKADFDHFYNDRMLENPFNKTWSIFSPWGFLTGEVTLGNSVKYVPKLVSDGKTMVEHISYFVLPILPTDTSQTSLASYNTVYFIANNIQDRLNGTWYYKNEDGSTYFMSNDSYLLPKITLMNWKNTMENMTISKAAYESHVGWFDSSDNIDVNRFDPEWLKSLLTVTVSYLKYGMTTELVDEDYEEINLKAANFTANDFEVITSSFGHGITNNGIRINISNVFDFQNGVLKIT